MTVPRSSVEGGERAEVVAQVLARADEGLPQWDGMTEDEREVYREPARAVVEALGPAEGGLPVEEEALRDSFDLYREKSGFALHTWDDSGEDVRADWRDAVKGYLDAVDSGRGPG